MKAFHWIIIVVLAGAAVFLIVRSEKLPVFSGQSPQPSPSPSIPPPFAQSGEVTAISSSHITIRYPDTVVVDGVNSSVYQQKSILIEETTPVFRLVKKGEGYEEIKAIVSDIKAGMNVSIHMAQKDGPALLPLKIQILETMSN